MRQRILRRLAGVLLLAGTAGRGQDATVATNMDLPGVFRLPVIQAQYARLTSAIQAEFRAARYAEAEALCGEAIALAGWVPEGHYNLACALARQGRTPEALDALARAVALGFRQAAHMKQDPDLASLRRERRFRVLLKEAKAEAAPTIQRVVEAAAVEAGVAWVTETNTMWDARNGVFRTLFRFAEPPGPAAAVVRDHGEAGELIRQWFREGSAAGNHGDLYDNRDGDHSNLDYAAFPQLARIEYAAPARDAGMHSGIQVMFFHNGVTLGNCSMAQTAGLYWRSLPRIAYADARAAMLLYLQYAVNHLYLYPEHRDHDPGFNGEGGYGDVYPANTPYVIISQGSSGSDRPFLDAVACTLAAFRPEVKAFLAGNGGLMPTVQMIFRSCNPRLPSPDGYLTGAAHPTVFSEETIDLAAMVNMAHVMTTDAVPPLVKIRVEEEDGAVAGRDYFDAGDRERLFDTPCAIARVARSMQYERRMVVSAAESRDVNGRPLTWHWVVLRGDADAIAIQPRDAAGAAAEIRVPYHAMPRPVEPGAELHSSRVDIGIFAHNGLYYSAPAFVTFFYLANERRVYDADRRIQTADYADPAARLNYVDPVLDFPKGWRDEYRYDDAGRLIGWTRHRGTEQEDFTADGALVTRTDELGRALEARTVRYLPRVREGQAPVLEQVPGDEILRYRYRSRRDLVGRIAGRRPAEPAESAPAADHEP